MPERDRKPDLAAADLDDEALARLLESAGRRPALPADDLDAIAGAARAAWSEAAAGGPARRARTGGRLPPSPTGARAAGRRRISGRWMAAAAAAAIALLGAGLWRWSEERTAPAAAAAIARLEAVRGAVVMVSDVEGTRALAAGDAVPQGAVLETASQDGEPRPSAALRLDRGAALRLDAATRVRLTSAREIELLAGGLYADTGAAASAASGQLRVRTVLGSARDVGTRFAVWLGAPSEAPAMQVLVREGVVAVEPADGPAGDRPQERAVAGEALVLHGDGRTERRSIAPDGPEWAWVIQAGPRFDAEGRTVGELLQWVERETGWRVRYEDDDLAAAAARIRFQTGGAATLELSPAQAPFVLLPGADLDAELLGGELLVRRYPAGPEARTPR